MWQCALNIRHGAVAGAAAAAGCSDATETNDVDCITTLCRGFTCFTHTHTHTKCNRLAVCAKYDRAASRLVRSKTLLKKRTVVERVSSPCVPRRWCAGCAMMCVV